VYPLSSPIRKGGKLNQQIYNDLWTTRRKPVYAPMSAELRSFVACLDPLAASATLQPDASFPRITIITPSYNQADFLERTILSVLNQGYPNLEYIVVDGGSSDGSVEIIRKYDEYLYYWVSEPDSGQSDAINKGLKLATGEWTGFQNSDDLFLPGSLHAFGEAMVEAPPADLLYGDLLHIDSDESVIDVHPLAPPHLWLQVTHGLQIHNQATLWRRNLLEKYGYLSEDLRFCFDYEFFTRLISSDAKTRRVDRLIGAFRHHQEAKSSTMLEVAASEDSWVIKEYGGAMLLMMPSWLRRSLGKAYVGIWYLLNGRGWVVRRRVRRRLTASIDRWRRSWA